MTDALRTLAADLCDRVLDAHRSAQAEALERTGSVRVLFESRGQGAGDETFALDERCEAAVDAWARDHARAGPLSVLTEDRGWRHFGPDPGRDGASIELASFDHGGPRLAVDPVDGTRNIACDLRSAWTVVSACGPGPGTPRARDVTHGTVSELPVTAAASARRFVADEGRGAAVESRACVLGEPIGAPCAPSVLRVDTSDEPRGYLPFFRYDPHLRPAAVALESDFLERLIEHEGASARHLYDDQYISSAGQLVLLALGTYRFVCDPRPLLGARTSTAATTSKPYDLAGALVLAREAGCVVTPLDAHQLPPADGSALPFDFPLDTSAQVGFVGYHNPATARRFAPHLVHALERAAPHRQPHADRP
ncbi:hypothetical protein Pla163_15030 [Planctomycetes bacterium Pla163]|uniref:Inositol monophosphatase family protein n=1 Tax=Rohdeia mirabilis TaxID=2528008 RepID=A0A518CYV3_9BACT|nr:hypothetical protein Pla163_15030 [Planctomycetes bacterium Pla163]